VTRRAAELSDRGAGRPLRPLGSVRTVYVRWAISTLAGAFLGVRFVSAAVDLNGQIDEPSSGHLDPGQRPHVECLTRLKQLDLTRVSRAATRLAHARLLLEVAAGQHSRPQARISPDKILILPICTRRIFFAYSFHRRWTFRRNGSLRIR
jgi:hypothetical protein